MSEENKNADGKSEDGAVDMKGKELPPKRNDPEAEKEEREAAKKGAKEAPAGAFVATCAIKVDKKTFKRGDAYAGKLYPDLLERKAIVPKAEWDKR